MANWFLDSAVGWLLQALVDTFLAVVGLLEQGLLVTPDVTALPQVQGLAGRSVWIVNTVFVLAFTAAAILHMAAGHSDRAGDQLRELAPRLVVGFVAAHFALPVCRQAIHLANALVAGVTTPDLDRAGALTAAGRHLQAAAATAAVPLLTLVLAVLIVSLLAAIVFGLLTRIAALLVLAAVAPLALALHALPQTDPIARLWWRAFAGCLAVPVLQAFTLHAGAWLLLDPRHLLPTVGPASPGAVVNLLVVAVLLYTTARVPALVGRYLLPGVGAGRSGVVATAVRVAAIRVIPIPRAGRMLRLAAGAR